MELKATLNKPCTKEQRINFIIEQNHKKGYEIRESRTSIEAWGRTQQEEERIDLESRVAYLEGQTGLIRPLRENVLTEGSAYSDYVKQKAAEIEALAEQLRNLQGA